MLAYVYYTSRSFAHNIKTYFHLYVCLASGLPTEADLGVKVATPVGTLCGQLLFGWLADVLGRKKMCKFADTSILKRLKPNLTSLFSRWYRVIGDNCGYFRSSCIWNRPRCQHYWSFGYMALPCKSHFFQC